MQNIIVMSHLRWNFVHQRPQHLLSRLAAHYRILFFEEPVFHPKKHCIPDPSARRQHALKQKKQGPDAAYITHRLIPDICRTWGVSLTSCV